jgi:hypothetical protein
VGIGHVEHARCLDQEEGAEALAGPQDGIAHSRQQAGCAGAVRQ